MKAKLCILLAVLLCMSCRIATALSTGNETDQLALLAFKALLADPAGALSSWNDSNHFCQWRGVSCGHSHQDRVTGLNLNSQRLSGPISPFIANLTFLQAVSLADNGFYGEIPQQLGQFHRLELLNLSPNSFHGEIPINSSNFSSITTLDLSGNKLTGRIPTEIGSLSKLNILIIGNNSISGPIPPTLGNLTSLTMISLPINQLEGGIPKELGKITSLKFLQFALNNLSGVIPASIYNLTSLYYFGLASNNLLTGSLPQSFGTYFPNLQYLYLGTNQFHGHIPPSLTNMTDLVVLRIEFNNFTGIVPPNLGRLRYLRYLNVAVNQLEANNAAEWEFMDSLINCSILQKLIMPSNMFGGILPQSVANLSTQLKKLEINDNQISGNIPFDIGNLISLNTLQMHVNHFTGTIPISICKLENLYYLALFLNALSGEIPSCIGSLTQLLRFRLDENNLEGSIPASLGNIKNPIDFDLSNNNLGGNIPREIFGITYLSNYMDLSYNHLNGSLPTEVGRLNKVGSLLIRSNKLSGELPSSLGMCASLEYLGLKHNFFNGSIPQSLGKIVGLKGLNLSEKHFSGLIPQSLIALRGIQELYLSHNNLTGEIPEFLENLTSLEHLTLSFNLLQGEAPTHGIFKNATAIAILSNEGLCGGVPELHLPACPQLQTISRRNWSPVLKTVVIVVACLIFFLLLGVLACIYPKKYKRSSISISSSVPALEHQFPKVSYKDLVKATDGFFSINLIGTGMCGSVYKGTLDGGESFVAVKVFNLLERGVSRSFIAECEAQRNLRHRNLLKILTSCSSWDQEGNEFKALVFQYMPNGSLDTWLHREEAQNDQVSNVLSLIQRLDIAIDVAAALEYLHDNYQPSIIHCDLKPSNVLLDHDMRARVGDFGLAKFYSHTINKSIYDPASSSAGIRGTIGYIAPEYGGGGLVRTSVDIYSYGVLLLELFTGKRPVDDMFKEGLDLCNFVETGISSTKSLMETADPSMLSEHQLNSNAHMNKNVAETIQSCLESAMRVGLRCVCQVPSQRMHIRDVVAELHSIRKAYLDLQLP